MSKNTKNTTLSRKPSNDMAHGEGMYKPTTRADQKGDGADFAFNGQMGDGVNRAGNRFAGNHAKLSMKEYYGMGPRRGNESDSGDERGIGPSVTKDPHKLTIATAKGEKPIGSTKVPRFPNPDAINVGN